MVAKTDFFESKKRLLKYGLGFNNEKLLIILFISKKILILCDSYIMNEINKHENKYIPEYKYKIRLISF